MTDTTTLCPVCEGDTETSPNCRYREYWDDLSVFRPYTDDERRDRDQGLDEARQEVRRRREGLPVTYSLAVASNGRMEAFPLFEKDSVAPWAPQEVRVEVAPGATEVLLPVVATTGDDPAAWEMVRLGRVPVSRDRSADVTVELVRPGDIRLTGPDVALLDDGPSWADIRTWTVGSNGTVPLTDLVCIVDLTGTPEEFAERTGFLRDLLGLLEKYDDRFHVALVECSDHRFRLDDVDHCVVVHPPDTPGKALARLAQWERFDPRNDLGAPIEDALAALPTRWRAGSTHILLTLGDRAPHPPRHEEGEPWLNGCPLGHDWEALLKAAKDDHDLCCVAVRWPRAENELLRSVLPRDTAWSALGGGAWHDSTDTTPRDIADLLGGTNPASALAVRAFRAKESQ